MLDNPSNQSLELSLLGHLQFAAPLKRIVYHSTPQALPLSYFMASNLASLLKASVNQHKQWLNHQPKMHYFTDRKLSEWSSPKGVSFSTAIDASGDTIYSLELEVNDIELLERVYQTTRYEMGQDHPYTLISMNNLGIALVRQYEYQQAEEMHRRQLEVCRRTLGRRHPFTLTSMNNLAVVLSEQGKNKQSERIHRRTLRLRKQVLGHEDRDTQASMYNLTLARNRTTSG